MLLLKQINLHNFLSHENTTIFFSENEKILIDGQSGSGKSSIFEAILYALYGEGRTEGRNLIRKGAKKAVVILELQSDIDLVEGQDSKTIHITRSITDKGKHTLEISIEDGANTKSAFPLSGIRELQNWIDHDLIGASYTLFINSVAYVQGNSESFVSQSAIKRKELLLEIIKAEDYDKYYESAKEKLASLATKKGGLLGQMTELEIQKQSLVSNISRKVSLEEDVKKFRTALEEQVTPKRKSLEQQISGFSVLDQTLGVLEKAITNAKTAKLSVETDLQKKRGLIAKKSELETHLLTVGPILETNIEKQKSKIQELRVRFSENAALDEVRQKLIDRKPVLIDRASHDARLVKKLGELETKPICPSGENCPYSGSLNEEKDLIIKEVARNSELTTQEQKDLSNWQEEYDKLPPRPDLSQNLNEISSAENDLEALVKEFSTLDKAKVELDEIKKIEVDIPVIEADLLTKTAQLDSLLKQKEETLASVDIETRKKMEADLALVVAEEKFINGTIYRGEASLEEISKSEKTLEDIEKKVDLIKNNELVVIEGQSQKVGLIKEAFGSKGIKTLVIDILIPKLEDKINEILSELSDFRIRLDTQKPTADEEGVKEGLYITIINEIGIELDFNNYSGGEKIRIIVAIQEALTSLVKSIGFRLMDEAITGLSPEMTESFASVLSRLQNRTPQVLCVSHLPEIKSLFDKQIVVEKIQGISQLQ